MSATTGWQPIETAPIGGGWMLLFLRRPSRNHVSYDIGSNDGHGWYDQNSLELESYDWRVTHWQPLPDAPSPPSDPKTTQEDV